MASFRVISSDSHVFEPPDLWTSRLEPRSRDRAPQVVLLDDGEWWWCDGQRVVGVGIGSQPGVRFEEPDKLRIAGSYETVPPGGYIPDEHVKDMDADGVDVGIIFPSVGFNLYTVVQDSVLLTELFSTYNDWLAEFCEPYPDRLKGIALLNVDEVQLGIKELERCAKMGFAGAMIPIYPPEGRRYDSPEYEPLWAAAQDMGMPLNLHLSTNRPGAGQEHQQKETQSPSFIANQDHWVRMSLGDIIFSGVFERYPGLRVGSVELELSWVPHFLDRIDYTYTQRARRDYWYRYKENVLPSDYFHRNVFLSFQEDALGIRDRHIIGVDNLLWGSDYPHQESTFPRSRQILEEVLSDCTEEEKAKIAGGNAARVYHLD